MLRRLALAAVLALPLLVACSSSDDSDSAQATECSTAIAGATVNDPATCSAAPANNVTVQAFRTDVIRTSSPPGHG